MKFQDLFQYFNLFWHLKSLFLVGIYGIVLFPPNWSSFKNPADPSIPNFQVIKNIAGNYGYLAFALMFILNFFTSVGLNAVPPIVHAEVFSFKYNSSHRISNVFLSYWLLSRYSLTNFFPGNFQTTFISMRSLIGTSVFYCGHFHKSVLQYRDLVNTFRCHSVLWSHQFDWVCRFLNLLQRMQSNAVE